MTVTPRAPRTREQSLFPPLSRRAQEGLDDKAGRKDRGAVASAARAAEAAGARVQHAPKHELNLVTGNRPHQVGGVGAVSV